MATKKQRVVRVVLAVLSSVLLTALVVVPLALGAHSARNDTGGTTSVVTRMIGSVTTTVPAGTTEPSTVGTSGTDPSDTTSQDPAVPRIPTQVLPRTETRDDPTRAIGDSGTDGADGGAGGAGGTHDGVGSTDGSTTD